MWLDRSSARQQGVRALPKISSFGIEAMDLVAEIYKLTDSFPKREVYSLTDQVRRAAVSVPSNIAEGQAHHSRREFRHFLRHFSGFARGSLRRQYCSAERLGYADHASRTESLPSASSRSRQNFERTDTRSPCPSSSGLLGTDYRVLGTRLSARERTDPARNMHAAPTKTSKAILTPGSLFTSGIRSDAAT